MNNILISFNKENILNHICNEEGRFIYFPHNIPAALDSVMLREILLRASASYFA